MLLDAFLQSACLGLPQVWQQLLSLLQQYPNGLTEAVILTQLKNGVRHKVGHQHTFHDSAVQRAQPHKYCSYAAPATQLYNFKGLLT